MKLRSLDYVAKSRKTASQRKSRVLQPRKRGKLPSRRQRRGRCDFIASEMFAPGRRASLTMPRLLFAALLMPALSFAQHPKVQPSAPAKSLLDITLQQQVGDKIVPVAAEHVFESGDVVRFKLHSDYNGYLYVSNQGTSGEFSTLFPSAETGSDNRITPNGEYIVPADGWFKISGPAGFETVYFLLSPTPLAQPTRAAQGSFAMPGPASSLKPRCNDAIFRARGECLDKSAGPNAVPAGAQLPPEISPLAGSASRDITFTHGNGSTTVGANAAKGPVIYTFRLAHH